MVNAELTPPAEPQADDHGEQDQEPNELNQPKALHPFRRYAKHHRRHLLHGNSQSAADSKNTGSESDQPPDSNLSGFTG